MASPGDIACPATPSCGVAGRETMPAGAAVIPRPPEGDSAKHGVHGLVPVGDEQGLVPGGAARPAAPDSRRRRPAAAPAATHPSCGRPGPDRQLRRLQARAAGQRGGRLGGQPRYLCGGSAASRAASCSLRSPLFAPPAQGPPRRQPVTAAGPRRSPRSPPRSARPASANPVAATRRTSRSALSSSGPRRGCVVTVLPPAHRVRLYRGPWPGSPGCAHRQYGLPHLRTISLTRAPAEVTNRGQLGTGGPGGPPARSAADWSATAPPSVV